MKALFVLLLMAIAVLQLAQGACVPVNGAITQDDCSNDCKRQLFPCQGVFVRTEAELSADCDKSHNCYAIGEYYGEYYEFVDRSTAATMGDCSTEVGWDYTPGTHEAHTSGQNTIDDCRKYCRQTCGLDSGKSRVCQYFTYINDGRCWCKKSKEPRNNKHNLGNTITSGGICDPYAMHEGYNCYPGHGGNLLGPEPYNANLHLADCQKACEDDENCEGFVVPNDVITNKASGNCYLRKNLELDKCGTESTYSTYRKINFNKPIKKVVRDVNGCQIKTNVNWIGEGAESDTEHRRSGGIQIRENYHIFWYDENYVDCQTRCKTVMKKKYFKFMADKPNTGGVYDKYLSFRYGEKYCWCYNKVVDLSSKNQMDVTTSGEAQCAEETGVCQTRNKECEPGVEGVCCKGASGWPTGWKGAKLCKADPNDYYNSHKCRDCLWRGERCDPKNDKCCTSGNEDTVCREQGREHVCAGSPGDRQKGERCSKNSDCWIGQYTRNNGIHQQCKDQVCKPYWCRTIKIKNAGRYYYNGRWVNHEDAVTRECLDTRPPSGWTQCNDADFIKSSQECCNGLGCKTTDGT